MHLAPAKMRRVPELDGVRALAAVSVFFFHVANRSPVIRSWGDPAMVHMNLGIEMFFVLSGFLVWGPFVRSLVTDAPLPALGSYTVRRVARLWPAYLVALATALMVGTTSARGPLGLLKHATLTHKYFSDTGGLGLGVSWTLVIEVSFYALLPILALLLLPWRRLRTSIVPPLLLIVYGCCSQVFDAFNPHTWPGIRLLPPALFTLGIGMLYATVAAGGSPTSPISRWLRRLASRPVLCEGSAAALFVLLVVIVPSSAGPINSRPGARVIEVLLHAAIAALVVLPFALGNETDAGPARFFRHPAVAWFGAVSFGFYLWQLPMLHLFGPLLRTHSNAVAMVGTLGGFLAALALAALSYRVLERPILDAVHRRTRTYPVANPPPTVERVESPAVA